MLPGDWKRTNVTPIFKKGSEVSPEDYRPIILTSQVIKVLETLVRFKIMKFQQLLKIGQMQLTWDMELTLPTSISVMHSIQYCIKGSFRS